MAASKIEKILKTLPTGFVEEAAGMSDDALRELMVQCEFNLTAIQTSQDNDEKLRGARDIAKDIVGGYNDGKKAQRAKIAYAQVLLTERGKAPLTDGEALE